MMKNELILSIIFVSCGVTFNGRVIFIAAQHMLVVVVFGAHKWKN